MKVLIVDDEYVIRIGLQSMIDWGRNGFQLIGLASNGVQAMDLVLEYRPDLVITDIKMPVMGGIELMKKLRELAAPPKFAVLSNHNEFELVRQAMQLGAEDYLLKLEIEPDELINMLRRVEEKLNLNKKNKSADIISGNKLSTDVNMMRKHFLRDYLNNFYANQKDFNDVMAFLNIELNAEYVYCIMIKTGEIYRFEDIPDDDLHMLNFSIINIAEEIAGGAFNSYCFEGRTGEFFMLVASKRLLEVPTSEKKLRQLGETISDMIQQYLNISSVISIGEGRAGYKGIKEAYQGAVRAMRCRFFNKNIKVVLWNDVQADILKLDEYSVYKNKDKLYRALDLHSTEELEGIFEAIRKDLAQLTLSKNIICNIMLEIFSMIREYLERYQIESSKVMKRSYCTYKQLVCIDNLCEADQWINDVKEDLIHYLEEESKIAYSKLISKAKEHMERYFYEQISLKQVADEVNLNPSYFSTILKRYTGKSYSEHITMLRVEKAKILLAQSDHKVYEVGEKVGYHNIYYFNRLFKKVTGLTPGEYKKMQNTL
jgi:YesN/AraC family two-component response regulator